MSWTHEFKLSTQAAQVMVGDEVIEWTNSPGPNKSWRSSSHSVVVSASRSHVSLGNNSKWWTSGQGNADDVWVRVRRKGAAVAVNTEACGAVGLDDLRIGDVIVSFRRSVDGPLCDSVAEYDLPWTVEEVGDDFVYGTRSGTASRTIIRSRSEARRDYPTFIWYIRRPSSSSSTKSKRVIDEFPGQCTLCGNKAYVGLFEIIHKDSNVACSARTK